MSASDDLWIDEQALPLQLPYDGVEFVIFEGRLTALLRATIAVSRGVDAYLDSLRDAAALPTHFPEEEEFVADQLGWARELVPTYSFGGLFALAFTTLEALLADVCDRVAMAVGSALADFAGAGSAPAVERMLEYLARVGNVHVERRGDEWHEFEILRQLRNRLVHSLGEGVSPNLNEQLKQTLGERTSSVDARTVEVGIYCVNAIARRVAEAMTTASY